MHGAICSLYFLEVPPTGDMKVCAIGQEKGTVLARTGLVSMRFMLDACHRHVAPLSVVSSRLGKGERAWN